MKLNRIFIALVIVLSGCKPTSATEYYVSNNGNDHANGKSEATAWATVSKVNSSTFRPGDIIHFKCGDTWREELKIPSSGSPDSYIKFTGYGEGDNPKILGSDQTSGWEFIGNKIWKANKSFPRNPYLDHSDIVFIDKQDKKCFGFYKPSKEQLMNEYDWTHINGNIYIFSSDDPGQSFKSIEVPQRDFCISTYNHEFLHIEGIDVGFAKRIGIQSNDAHCEHLDLHGIIIEKCNVEFIGGKSIGGSNTTGFGIGLVYSDMLIRNCTIRNCGRRGISLDLYGNGFTATNAIIEYCTLYNGYHTTGLDINTGSGSYTAGWDGVIFRNNCVYDAENEEKSLLTNLIFIQRYGNSTLKNFYIYSNIFKFSAGYGVAIESGDNIFIYNNTFYGHNIKTAPVFHIYADTRLNNLVIKNNIFYSLLANDNKGNGSAIVLYGVDPSEAKVDNNLYYRINNLLRILLINGSSYYMNSKSAINRNLGWESNGVFADPLFVSPSDLMLQHGSPAIGKGTIVTEVKNDYQGKAFLNPPSIGALEVN